ncbi:L-rhamnose 1-epimerase, partial [Salmonella enterica subsp. enterica serovar Kentucky str. 0253]
MIRKAFVMQVNADAHEEYQRRHNPIWPELEAVIKISRRASLRDLSRSGA